ncbi:uncharacterized protein LOC144744059 [Ciona intestinalis]
MSWLRIISVVLLFDLTLTLGQLTCDYSLYSRFRCTRFARGAVVTPVQCRAAGCCYDLFSTAAPSTRCFLAREEVNMRFKPTVHPNTGQRNSKYINCSIRFLRYFSDTRFPDIKI